MTSHLTSPYSKVPLEDKIKIHAGISREDHDALFVKMFPRHGAQDRIIACLIHSFVNACHDAGIPMFYTAANEITAVKLLSNVSFSYNATPSVTN
jgi:hypothetical protein